MTRRTPLFALLTALLAAFATMVALGLMTATTSKDAAASTPPRGDRDVILNLFQWTWNSVASECTSTIGPAGFGYVQVSPPNEHVTGTQWWTSYQPVSYQIESKLGTRAEFAAMVDACDAAGVGVIADAVVNHMAADSGSGVAGSTYGQDSFPGIYGGNDFNDCRTDISDYGNRWEVQNCRLVSLQDLRTGSDYVRGRLADYLNDLTSLGVAGFRIDAAKHMPAEDLAAIKAQSSGAFWVQEVIGAAGEPIQPSEYTGNGDVHEFDYGRQLRNDFDGQIKNLRYIGDDKLPSDVASVFVDNHDTERNGETMNYTWGAKYVLANTFMLSWPYGSPTVYSGYEFSGHDAGVPGSTDTSVPDANCGGVFTCTQRWTEIRGMVGFHNEVAGTSVTNWWDDGSNNIGYGRGDRGYVAINNTGSSVTRTYQTSLPAGTYCDVVAASDCSVTLTVDGAGRLDATLPAYGALAVHIGATSGSAPSPTPDAGDVSVAVHAETVWGQSVYLVGDRPELGSWTPSDGVALSAASYPTWTGTVDLPAGTAFEYKYVKIDESGNVTWESGANRTATVGPDGSLGLNDAWK
ncbi:carbohydrate-binding module family 20 domain-containing protein [Myceligenerans salitolerans]|uniref:Alpha-amylase n=1 Tax=Myceligenerans salitolerans TaxID=1230528 RepID=A0ABS3I4T8_9MICO|nr:carbohydrate-binding module family 20 domain-containing protein [Myceligenerans salitolerans]MBO0608031.1 alpha amylase C-terminal domain-containing protein [Myceligenerans salitolerans]